LVEPAELNLVGEKAGLDHRSRHAKAGRKPLMVNKVLFFGVPSNHRVLP
jgi:hypothetical protein